VDLTARAVAKIVHPTLQAVRRIGHRYKRGGLPGAPQQCAIESKSIVRAFGTAQGTPANADVPRPTVLKPFISELQASSSQLRSPIHAGCRKLTIMSPLCWL
jgi:hypothetical protein